MSWTRRSAQVVATASVVAAWTALYLVLVVNSKPPSYPTTAAQANRDLATLLAIPTFLWVAAALLIVHHWWAGPGHRLSTMDSPGRLLAAAVAALPDERRDWGAGMTGELAEVRGRAARWRFALSAARTPLWLPPAGGWPLFALVAGAVAAAIAASGPAVGSAVPGLAIFTVGFVGFVGAWLVVAIARSRRPRATLRMPALLVTAGVATAIAMTVVFLLRDPAAARFLPPSGALFLAAVLAACLWVAAASRQSRGTGRLAPHIGVATGVVYAIGFLLLIRGIQSASVAESARQGMEALAIQMLIFGPGTLCFALGSIASSRGRSFRTGVLAGVWALITILPFMYAVWLFGSLHMYEINGGALLWGDGAPEGENLADALFWVLGLGLVFGLPFAVIGAAVGGYTPAHRAQTGGATAGGHVA
jgi:hypothetical protein